MGIAANKFRLLFLKGSKSDVEYRITLIFQRRKALMQQAMQFSSDYSNNLFAGNNGYDDIPGPLPGFVGTDIPTSPLPTGEFEEKLLVLQKLDKEMELDAEQLKVQMETYASEIESIDKLLKKNIEKDYKTFGG